MKKICLTCIALMSVVLLMAGCSKHAKPYSPEMAQGEWMLFGGDAECLTIKKDHILIPSSSGNIEKRYFSIKKILELNKDSQIYRITTSEPESFNIQIINSDVFIFSFLGHALAVRADAIQKKADFNDILGKWKPKEWISDCLEIDIKKDGIQFNEFCGKGFVKVLELVSIGDARVFLMEGGFFTDDCFTIKIIDGNSIALFDGKTKTILVRDKVGTYGL